MWNTTWSWSDTIKDEATEGFVVLCEFAFALEDVNFYLWLVVACGTKYFGAAGWNGSVAVNKWSANTAHGFDTEGKWSNIEKKNVLYITGKNTTLDCCTDCNDLIWVYALHWVFAEEFLYAFNDGWHTSHTTDHNYVSDIGSLETCIVESFLDWAIEAIKKWRYELFKLCTSKGKFEVLRAISVGSNIWKVDFYFRSGAKLLLCLLCLILDTLHCGRIFAKINMIVFFKFFKDVINNLVIEVFTTKVSITVGCFYFKDAITELEDGNIECTTTKVEYDDLLIFILF